MSKKFRINRNCGTRNVSFSSGDIIDETIIKRYSIPEMFYTEYKSDPEDSKATEKVEITKPANDVVKINAPEAPKEVTEDVPVAEKVEEKKEVASEVTKPEPKKQARRARRTKKK